MGTHCAAGSTAYEATIRCGTASSVVSVNFKIALTNISSSKTNGRKLMARKVKVDVRLTH